MQQVLLDFLATWSGRGVTQAALEDRGFFMHRAWQERIDRFCGGREVDDLNRYWDDVAREFVSSAGKGDPNSRTFIVEPRFRSSYLDELAVKMASAKPPYRYPSLSKCVSEYNFRVTSDRSFLESESSAFEALKEEEFVRHAITTQGWSGLKRDIVPFVGEFSEPKGFVRRRNRFLKRFPQKFVFEIKVDAGGNPECGVGLPLQLFIYNAASSDFVFEASLLDMIVPGFSRYVVCHSPSSYVLGILANVELVDILAATFSTT